ncbi:MAG: hypothetical protein JST22_05380 [Bacteroidetes bacterium]|nr:hypothetical protein [Bacteroidota bacterium]
MLLLDHVARHYAAWLRGEQFANVILFKGGALELWERYFSSENYLYRIHNDFAAELLLREVDRVDGPISLLEIGAGTGGATAAMLQALIDVGHNRPVVVEITDISPYLLRRTISRLESLVPPWMELRYRKIDFNEPLNRQGVAEGGTTFVIAVNALHNAADIVGCLRGLRGALADVGGIVLSESLCGADQMVHQEFIFNLLGHRQAGPVRYFQNSLSRFLDTAGWRSVFTDAGLTADVIAGGNRKEIALAAIVR